MASSTPLDDVFVTALGGEVSLGRGLHVVVEDSDALLPLQIRSKHDLRLTAGPGKFGAGEIDSFRFRHFTWDPFFKEGSHWRGNLSYGTVTLTFQVNDGGEFTMSLAVLPAKLSQRQIDLMRSTLAELADELVLSGQGVARGAAKRTRHRPSEPGDTLRQIVEYVSGVLPALEDIGRHPRTRLTVARQVCLPWAEKDVSESLDISENALIAQIVGEWTRMLDWSHRAACMAGELVQSQRLANAPDSVVTKAEKHRTNELKQDQERLQHCAATAMALKLRLLRALPWANSIRRSVQTLTTSPLTERDHRYRAVVRAWAAIRRECVVVDAERLGSLTDTVASFMYERWALLAICAMLVRDGWQIRGAGLAASVRRGVFEVSLKGPLELNFERGCDRLALFYEPQVRLLKVKGKSPDRTAAAVELLRSDPTIVPGFYTTRRYCTPDYVFVLQRNGRSCSVAAGDAVFCPILASETGAEWERRMSSTHGLSGKVRTVRDDYASEMLYLDSNFGVTSALPHAGFVVYPGADESAEWFDDDLGIVPFPLCPTDEDEFLGSAQAEGGRRRLSQLISTLEDALAASVGP